MAEYTHQTNKPQKAPFIRGLPFIGSALDMRYDPLAYFVKMYQEHGPIFRVGLPNRVITVMAGIEANQFLSQESDKVMESEILFGEMGHELNTDKFLTAIDGPAHKHLRKLMRPGYSRSQMAPHIGAMLAEVDAAVDNIRPGEDFSVFTALRQVVTNQLGTVVVGMAPGDYFEDISTFLGFNLNVTVVKLWPRLAFILPKYKRARARTLELGAKVLEYHRQNPPGPDRPQDLIDDMLEALDESGLPYEESMLIATAVGPYVAGIDTVASSISFMVHALLAHPEVLEQVQAEADALFAGGVPSFEAFRNMPATHNTVLETLRMYPVAPFTPRHATEDFEFMGYTIEKGEEVFFAQTVTHFLPEYYPNPEQFDISRYESGGRSKPGAFTPYSLGAHLCLGAGMAESQMMITIARLVHRLDLEFARPQDRELTIHATPLPNPGRGFRARVRAHRQATVLA